MRLQISINYGIRILQYLHENNDGLYTATNIAESVGMTYPFFIKIANQLKKNGLLNSVQGRNGGYQLGKSAHEISLYDVFVCIEGELKINSHIQKSPVEPQSEVDIHDLHTFLHSLQKKIIREMSSHSIADLA